MPPPFATRAQLHSWLEAHGLAHVARFNLEAAAPFLDESLWKALRAAGAKRRLSDLASEEGIAAATKDWLADPRLKADAPIAVQKLIALEEEQAQRAREQLSKRLSPPVDERLVEVHASLLKLRTKFTDAIAPRTDDALAGENLDFDPALPGFRCKGLLPTEFPTRLGGGFQRPLTRLTVLRDGSKVECSCGAIVCVHGLATLDTVLLRLHGGLQPTVVEELARPAWKRTLQALEAALAKELETRATADDVVTFWLGATETEVFVTGCLNGEPTSRSDLLARVKKPADLPLVALMPEEGEPASRTFLESLIGHPRVFAQRDPSLPVKIERGPIGVAADERGGVVRLAAALEGAALPPGLLERVKRSKPDELVHLWDEGARVLTLLEIRPEVRALLEVLGRDNSTFPPEAHGALLQSLGKLAQHVPVAMPRSVMGDSVPAELTPVLRLEPRRSGAVELEVRIRPLAEAAALGPGRGSRDVHVRRGDKPFHTVRDLEAELELAHQLVAALPLQEAVQSELNPFAFEFERTEKLFEVLEAAGRRAAPPQLEWVGNPLRVVGSLGPRALRVAMKEEGSFFGVLGELNVHGERVELARLIEAARREARYVQVSQHNWVELTEVLRRHLARVGEHVHHTKKEMLVGPAAVFALRMLQDAGATIEGDSAWKSLLERVEAARGLDPKLPRGLKAKLRPYQLDGFRWLCRLAAWGAGGVLADDMGLGKTVQSLALLLHRAKLGPAVVVAPTSLSYNWKAEAARFAPSLKVHVYAEATDRDALLEKLKAGDVLVISYGLVVRDVKKFASRQFATVVFDEAQNVKNAQTQRFLAAKAIEAEFRFALSGTPLENHLGELWSLFALVFPQLLGPWPAFRIDFALPIEKINDPWALQALTNRIEPFILRRTKNEVEKELPPRIEIHVPVLLSPEEWELYEDTRLAALSDLETPSYELKQQERRVQVLAMLTRLRLAAAHPKLLDDRSTIPSSRLAKLIELVEELRAEGQAMLIFSQFTSHLDLVKEALEARGHRLLVLDGSTAPAERHERTSAFQSGEVSIFLLSLKAGGVGLNLTAATNVIHLDPWWNPAVEAQASDRAHRIGQTRTVTIYRLVALNTVEEKMLHLQERKRALIARVLSGKDLAGKLETDELIELLRNATPVPPPKE